ncbi:hypothetical protein ACU4GI_47160 (plasmid) [Cupriavidus basilensis]
MKPRMLSLDNFVGIQSGLGKPQVTLDLQHLDPSINLVALAGPNGTGKTTIMDNLHPFRVMPSHASSPTPNAFSYWDHVFGAQAAKTLEWEHDGQRFRTQLVFRQTGKTKKQDAYLTTRHGDNWVPVTLPNGTVSDGKTETYDACVEHFLGKPEVFFTAHFSAQSRIPLSAMSAGDVKSLLSSMLGHDQIRVQGERASAVGKLLFQQLSSAQEDLRMAVAAESRAAELSGQLVFAAAALQRTVTTVDTTQHAVTAATATLATTQAQREAQASIRAQRAQLEQQQQQTARDATQQQAEAEREAAARKRDLQQAAAQSKTQLAGQATEIQRLRREQETRHALLAQEPAVQQAEAALARAKVTLEALGKQRHALDAPIATLAQQRVALTTVTAAHQQTIADGSATKQKVASMLDSAKLAAEVPCAGSDLQPKCPLLASALAAKAALPGAQAQLQDMRKSFEVSRSRSQTITATIVELEAKDVEARQLDQLIRAANDDMLRLSRVANQREALAAAKLAWPETERRLKDLAQSEAGLNQQLAELTQRIGTIDQETVAKRAAIEAARVAKVAELQALQASLPAVLANDAVDVAQRALATANQQLATAKRVQAEAQAASQERMQALTLQEADAARKPQLQALCSALSDEVAWWGLLAKCFSNDGLIALSIDDAGPAISQLCNRLLEDCYGGRFAVQMVTQRTTQTGTVRETFEIHVRDVERSECKPLGVMSGGERVWINECLVRALALHMARGGGSSVHTLFSDESDGPLDPNRKRQFIAMKRAVLAAGGYEREFFITQTPELTAMADAIIDIPSL